MECLKEVTLYRQNDDAKIGLTLWYGGSDASDVYIGEVRTVPNFWPRISRSCHIILMCLKKVEVTWHNKCWRRMLTVIYNNFN